MGAQAPIDPPFNCRHSPALWLSPAPLISTRPERGCAPTLCFLLEPSRHGIFELAQRNTDSFNGVARQSRRGAARSRLIIAFPACRRRACRIGCRPLLVCRGCARLRGWVKVCCCRWRRGELEQCVLLACLDSLGRCHLLLAAANGRQQILSAARAAMGVPGAPTFRGSPQSPAVLRVPRAAVCRASFWRGRRRVCPLYVSTVKY